MNVEILWHKLFHIVYFRKFIILCIKIILQIRKICIDIIPETNDLILLYMNKYIATKYI